MGLSTRHSRKSDFPATRKRSVTRCQPPNHSRTSRSSKDVGRRRAHQRRGGPGRRRGRSRSRRRRWRQVRLHVRAGRPEGCPQDRPRPSPGPHVCPQRGLRGGGVQEAGRCPLRRAQDPDSIPFTRPVTPHILHWAGFELKGIFYASSSGTATTFREPCMEGETGFQAREVKRLLGVQCVYRLLCDSRSSVTKKWCRAAGVSNTKRKEI